MAIICNCAAIRSGELQDAFDKIAQEKGSDYKITFKDVKNHLNLPERIKDGQSKRGIDKEGRSRCGTCIESFMEAIAQINDYGEFDSLNRPVKGKSKSSDVDHLGVGHYVP